MLCVTATLQEDIRVLKWKESAFEALLKVASVVEEGNNNSIHNKYYYYY